MNIKRAKLPWHRSYNFRVWYCQHKRCIRWFVTGLFVGLLLCIGEWVMNLYIAKLEAEYQKVSVLERAWAKEMLGAPKTPEDAVVFKEPVGWKFAMNWCKAGWQEECR